MIAGTGTRIFACHFAGSVSVGIKPSVASVTTPLHDSPLPVQLTLVAARYGTSLSITYEYCRDRLLCLWRIPASSDASVPQGVVVTPNQLVRGFLGERL